MEKGSFWTRSRAIKTTYFNLEETMREDRFTVSPNPSDGHLTLHFDLLSGLAEINVYKSTGQWVDTFVVNTDTTKEHDYILPDLGNGLYFLVLRNNEGTVVRKVSVVR